VHYDLRALPARNDVYIYTVSALPGKGLFDKGVLIEAMASLPPELFTTSVGQGIIQLIVSNLCQKKDKRFLKLEETKSPGAWLYVYWHD